MMFSKIQYSLALLSLCAASPAFARPEATGGFPLGEKSRVHTMLDLGVGYDSNRASNGAGTRIDDWRAQFLPAISVNVPGSSITLDALAQLSIQTYFGTNALLASDAFVGGNVNISFTAGGGDSVVGFELTEGLFRTPSFLSVDQEGIGTIGVEEISFLQWYNRTEANMVLRPGGGALEFRIGYGNELRLFDELAEAQKHQALFEAKLRFLPKTAITFNADLGFYSEDKDYKANPYNLTVGLLGQVTQGLTTVVKVGYGDTLTYLRGESFFGATSPNNIRSVIVTLRLEYTFDSGTSLTAGYDRVMRQAIGVGTGYAVDAPYLKAQVEIGERFTLAALGRIEFRTFAGPADRSSKVYIADLRADYWFFDFLRGGVAYQMLSQDSDAGVVIGAPLPEATRHQVLLTMGLYY